MSFSSALSSSSLSSSAPSHTSRSSGDWLSGAPDSHSGSYSRLINNETHEIYHQPESGQAAGGESEAGRGLASHCLASLTFTATFASRSAISQRGHFICVLSQLYKYMFRIELEHTWSKFGT